MIIILVVKILQKLLIIMKIMFYYSPKPLLKRNYFSKMNHLAFTKLKKKP